MSISEYPHIENVSAKKFMDDFLEYHPEAKLIRWIAEEKINGTNMHLIFPPDDIMTFASRGQLLTPDLPDHFGFRTWIASNIQEFIAEMIRVAQTENKTYRIYGEYFGPRICKGVDYGKEKRLIFFNISVNDVFLSQKEFYEFMKKHNAAHLTIKAVSSALPFDEILKVNPVFISNYSPTGDEAEGVVIKPYDVVINDGHNHPVFFKIKTENFREKSRTPKPEGLESTPSPTGILIPYITPARINSCISKEGPLTSKKDIGRYIKKIQHDIIQDYKMDHPEVEVVPAWEISMIGRHIATELLKEISV